MKNCIYGFITKKLKNSKIFIAIFSCFYGLIYALNQNLIINNMCCFVFLIISFKLIRINSLKQSIKPLIFMILVSDLGVYLLDNRSSDVTI